MKTVKVKFIGFWDGYVPEDDIYFRLLSKHFNVKICEDADYIFCSVFGNQYDYCRYPQIRIMISEENYIPDFNFVDYAISHYPLSLKDRHCCYPGFIDRRGYCEELVKKERLFDRTILQEKTYFANLICSHESDNGIRREFFQELSKYKRVESPGPYLNNNSTKVSLGESKIEFQRKSKFTLCFESTDHQGFITEKITDAFYADTIPIYYGSEVADEVFNPKAYINCSHYKSRDEVIKKIIELDTDDDKYLEMLSQPIFCNPQSVTDKIVELELFLAHIFEQEYRKGYRRSRFAVAKSYENYILTHMYPDKKCNGITSQELIRLIIWRVYRKIKSNILDIK